MEYPNINAKTILFSVFQNDQTLEENLKRSFSVSTFFQKVLEIPLIPVEGSYLGTKELSFMLCYPNKDTLGILGRLMKETKQHSILFIDNENIAYLLYTVTGKVETLGTISLDSVAIDGENYSKFTMLDKEVYLNIVARTGINQLVVA